MSLIFKATIRSNGKVETFNFPTSILRMDKKFNCDVDQNFEILEATFPGHIENVGSIRFLNEVARYFEELPFSGLLSNGLVDKILDYFGTSIFEISENKNFQIIRNEYIPDELVYKVLDLGNGYSAFVGREIPIKTLKEGA